MAWPLLDDFKEALEPIIAGALAQLAAIVGDQPTRVEQVMWFTTTDHRHLIEEQRPNWNVVSPHTDDALRAQTNFGGLVRMLASDERGRRRMLGPMLLTEEEARANEEGSALMLAHRLAFFLHHYFDAGGGSLTFDPDRFAIIYEALVRFVEMDSTPFVCYLAVSTLSVNDEIELAPGLILRPFYAAEKTELRHRYAGFGGSVVNDFELLFWTALIESRYEHQPGTPIESNAPVTNAEPVIRALRLMKDETVGAAVYWMEPSGLWFDSDAFVVGAGRGLAPTLRATPTYELTPNDTIELERLVALLQAHRERTEDEAWRRIDLALRRFDQLYERMQPADRMVDIWVALEALFVPEREGALSFRSSLRIARLLGETLQERQELFAMIKDSYRIRSKVVHGRRIDDQKVAATAESSERLLRRVLIRFLEEPTLNVAELDLA